MNALRIDASGDTVRYVYDCQCCGAVVDRDEVLIKVAGDGALGMLGVGPLFLGCPHCGIILSGVADMTLHQKWAEEVVGEVQEVVE